jgi:hypothetical protein
MAKPVYFHSTGFENHKSRLFVFYLVDKSTIIQSDFGTSHVIDANEETLNQQSSPA